MRPLVLCLVAVGGVAAQPFTGGPAVHIKQDSGLHQVVGGFRTGVHTDHIPLCGYVTYSPSGPVSISGGGGARLGEAQGYSAWAGVSYTVKPLTQNLRQPALQLVGGVGYADFEAGDEDVSQLDMPVGVGAFVSLPPPGVNVQAWLLGGGHVRRTEVRGASAQTKLGAVGSVGLRLAMTSGLGLHLAFDILVIEGRSGEVDTERAAVLGAHYVHAF